ncbi:MAG: tRNA (adenosine(37)-N6)-threonylcarbamoyltransferase complex dimerization subunit type 1 TsaB [Oscillospiraceae bacterium]
MTIFAVDSSSKAGSAALLCDGALLYEAYANEGLTHSETLLSRCDEVFKNTGKTPSDIDYFAVSSGPGSFTGLRIGMSAVKGLAFAANRRCVPVPTMEALACGQCETDRLVVTVCDARRSRVYFAAFSCCGSRPKRMAEDAILTLEELRDFAANQEKKLLLVGDAAEMCYNFIKDKVSCTVAEGESNYVHASQVARLAAAMICERQDVSASELAPDYLLPSQAERNRNEKK